MHIFFIASISLLRCPLCRVLCVVKRQHWRLLCINTTVGSMLQVMWMHHHGATKKQQPGVSNQESATNNQQPTTSIQHSHLACKWNAINCQSQSTKYANIKCQIKIQNKNSNQNGRLCMCTFISTRSSCPSPSLSLYLCVSSDFCTTSCSVFISFYIFVFVIFL